MDISLQDWSPLCADVVFSRDTFYCNLRKTDVFPPTPQVHQNGTKKVQRPLKIKTKDVTGYNKRVFITQNYFTHDYLRYAPIVLVTNIIITLNAINYLTKTFITDIWQERKFDSTFWKKKNIAFNFPWIIHQYLCFFINILGVLGILERQKKIRKATKKWNLQ